MTQFPTKRGAWRRKELRMKISKQDALTWFRFFAELPEDEDLLPRQQEIALALF